MIRKCTGHDFETLYEIINDAASAYEGLIPEDCWKTPYMTRDELWHEIEDGVEFWGHEKDGRLIGVMGIQPVRDVTLIRHAYVRSDNRNRGIGTKLLAHLMPKAKTPILIGTWAAASWAVRFYEKSGFVLVSLEEKTRLLKKYWSISERQVETSVVLTNRPEEQTET